MPPELRDFTFKEKQTAIDFDIDEFGNPLELPGESQYWSNTSSEPLAPAEAYS